MADGWKAFQAKVADLQNVGDPKYVAQAGQIVLSAAKLMCSGFRLSSGELRNSLGSTVRTTLDGAEAYIGTNKEYASYVEFGTGPVGAKNHQGTAPDAGIVYTLSPWWIHENRVDPRAASVYGWPYRDTDQGRFYRVSGQPAHPYLYPAFEDNKKLIADILAKGMEEVFKN